MIYGTINHIHWPIPFKSVGGLVGTCTIAGGELPTAFRAVTEMLTAEYDTYM